MWAKMASTFQAGFHPYSQLAEAVQTDMSIYTPLPGHSSLHGKASPTPRGTRHAFFKEANLLLWGQKQAYSSLANHPNNWKWPAGTQVSSPKAVGPQGCWPYNRKKGVASTAS